MAAVPDTVSLLEQMNTLVCIWGTAVALPSTLFLLQVYKVFPEAICSQLARSGLELPCSVPGAHQLSSPT